MSEILISDVGHMAYCVLLRFKRVTLLSVYLLGVSKIPRASPPSFSIGEDRARTFGPNPELKGDAGKIKGTPTRALD